MNSRYHIFIISCMVWATNSSCQAPLDTKTAGENITTGPNGTAVAKTTKVKPKQIIRVTHLVLNTDFASHHNELDYPALAATNIKIGIAEKPLFFIDEFNKADHNRKLELMTRAPWALTKQFHKSKNPVVKENPWFLYQGLEDFKKLKNVYASELKSKMEALNNGFLKTFNELLVELPLISISTTQGKVGFSQLWLDAVTQQQRDGVLKEITAEIVSKKANAACTELIRFIGVLGHAFSEDERVKALIKLLDISSESDESIRLINAIFQDIKDGPDAQTIAQMAIQDRDLKA